MPPLYLGLHEDTNASVAVVDGEGRLVAALAEERLSRTKYHAGFPERALRWLQDSGAVPPGLPADRVRVVGANPYHPVSRVLGERMPQGGRDFLAPMQTLHVAWHELLFRAGPLRAVVRRACAEALRRRFDREVPLFGHHRAHAASAWYCGPFDEATVVTCDNLGDGQSATAWRGQRGQLEPLWQVGAWHSPGQFYGEVATLLGIDPMTAGKVTGLAARGHPDEAARLLRARLRVAPDGRSFRGSRPWERRRGAGSLRGLKGLSPADLAAGAQQVLEDALLPFIAQAVRTTGCGNVAVAGGVFGNVTLNRRILELPGVEALSVHPAMSDQGIATGAALLALAQDRGGLTPQALPHVFWGPSFDEAACARALQDAGLEAHRPASLPDAVAELLAAGKVVARFDGALEYGPRALGNRSLLVRPDDPSVNEWLNERLDRSEFMPFAPVTLAEEAPAIYEGLDPAAACVPFMTIALPVRDQAQPSHRGVVHVDGTARPQVLSREANPGMHDILSAFHRRTGLPSLVNTSFNLHGEPIVCSPQEAIATFRAAGLDALVLGPFLVVGGTRSA